VKTILVIDDDPLVRRAIGRILQKRGYGVHLAADGPQGLQTYRFARPDLVITDIVMPAKDGLETIRDGARRQRNDRQTVRAGGTLGQGVGKSGGRSGSPRHLLSRIRPGAGRRWAVLPRHRIAG
jgi:Response regulator receiver domain